MGRSKSHRTIKPEPTPQQSPQRLAEDLLARGLVSPQVALADVRGADFVRDSERIAHGKGRSRRSRRRNEEKRR